MRLLYFINSITNSGGMERIVIDKINYLANLNGYEVSIAYYGTDQDRPFFPIDERVACKAIASIKGTSSFIKRIATIFIIRKALLDLIDEVAPDVIVNANMKLVSWLLPFVRKRIPKVVELHFSWIGMRNINNEIYGRNFYKSWFNNFLRNHFYPLYERCVLLTDDDLRDWGFKNAVVIPNFTNLQMPDNDCVVKERIAVNVGRLSIPKNQRLLVDAWKIVYPQEPAWKLEIWGEGEFENDLSNQIHHLGLDGIVSLKGTSHHIDIIYGYASFFVLSSSYEGQPLVMIEALQAGLPCVCTKVNGVRGTIKNGYNGYIVDDMTAEQLAEGILKMIRSERKPEMSQNARESAKTFDKEHVMSTWISLFDDLIHENRN